jgi:sterol desaturase/sphingolipid hydroxylase (fatty acid hydroxylase superfamily)
LASPLIFFRGLWSLYLHSNMDLELGPLQILIGSPQLHRWHHSRENCNCNYSNYSPWLDVLFGTYRSPQTQPEKFGIAEKIPVNYISFFLHPFRKLSGFLPPMLPPHERGDLG